ncbi:helix-turn-helix transcriptional regulator [Actinokineospora sp. NBRC 105648]|uniref:helix-turn-helix domain-containing protein n=1 Tax=Actinokineospora sp. NBRC 105648 TaxID=3032206 RepID=UPI0024A1628B|nr:helix-turn-helix transcriptional regulator [Actinokineospora sp. NBRC 105648]GLZ39239.1 transcriptional regulator [Actinokineospora sp. NBRC 105648]
MPKPRQKPQARGLAAGLRAARRVTPLSAMDVSAKLGWSQSTISRIETGKRNAAPEEVIAMLALYGVTGDERERLVALARDADRTTWLETKYRMVPEQAKTMALYEREASEIVDFGLILMPGLLQTPAYVRALMNSGGVPVASIEPRVQLRLERQTVLDRPKPPKLLAIMDEAVLHRRFGGRRVMAEQLQHLLAMARNPDIDLRVIPFDHGGHAGVDGGFHLVRFEDASPVVHLEHTRSGLFLDERDDVAPYEAAIASMATVALDAEQSARLVTEVLATYQQE